MLTFWNKRVWFKVKFSDDKCVDFNKKDNGGDTGIDNGNRIAGNMYPLNVYIYFGTDNSIYTFNCPNKP